MGGVKNGVAAAVLGGQDPAGFGGGKFKVGDGNDGYNAVVPGYFADFPAGFGGGDRKLTASQQRRDDVIRVSFHRDRQVHHFGAAQGRTGEGICTHQPPDDGGGGTSQPPGEGKPQIDLQFHRRGRLTQVLVESDKGLIGEVVGVGGYAIGFNPPNGDRYRVRSGFRPGQFPIGDLQPIIKR